MDQGSEWLKEIAAKMKGAVESGTAPTKERLTVRELLAKFGASRRGDRITRSIRNGLEKHGLITNPDFEVGWIDSQITINLDSDASEQVKVHHTSDPTHRIQSLGAANKKPKSVKPDASLEKAMTIMLRYDYSQLPVMTSSKSVSGVISWNSIGECLSVGRKCDYVRQCMVQAEVLRFNTPLFKAIAPIAEHGYALVRGKDKTITGIITAADLSFQFMQLAGPFLFIGEIEGYLRHLIHGKFTREQLQAASVSEEGRIIEGSGDLTLGGYCRLLENKDNWQRLNLRIDRAKFVNYLNDVRQIRNDVMHFNPDGLSEYETRKLRDIARFFEHLVRIKAM